MEQNPVALVTGASRGSGDSEAKASVSCLSLHEDLGWLRSLL